MATNLAPLQQEIRSISDRREVIARLVSGDLKVKYEGAVLGYFWSVMEPLLMTAVYFYLLAIIFDVRRVPAYALFLVSGILPWQWFNATISDATRALRNNASLITKVHMPREIFPIAALASKTAEFIASLLVLIAFAFVYRVGPSRYIVFFPAAVAIQAALLMGLSFALAAANTLLRDIERVIRPILRALFYLTPVLYPASKVMAGGLPHALKLIYRLNPLVGIFELYHAGWYPQQFLGWSNPLIALVESTVILVGGWVGFRKLEPYVLKEL